MWQYVRLWAWLVITTLGILGTVRVLQQKACARPIPHIVAVFGATWLACWNAYTTDRMIVLLSAPHRCGARQRNVPDVTATTTNPTYARPSDGGGHQPNASNASNTYCTFEIGRTAAPSAEDSLHNLWGACRGRLSPWLRHCELTTATTAVLVINACLSAAYLVVASSRACVATAIAAYNIVVGIAAAALAARFPSPHARDKLPRTPLVAA